MFAVWSASNAIGYCASPLTKMLLMWWFAMNSCTNCMSALLSRTNGMPSFRRTTEWVQLRCVYDAKPLEFNETEWALTALARDSLPIQGGRHHLHTEECSSCLGWCCKWAVAGWQGSHQICTNLPWEAWGQQEHQATWYAWDRRCSNTCICCGRFYAGMGTIHQHFFSRFNMWVWI